MSNWYYYDVSGTKVGPISDAVLKQFTQAGVIRPEMLIENEVGQQSKAGQVKGFVYRRQLKFQVYWFG